VAATNRDLPSLIRQEKFRRDLYYRFSTHELGIRRCGSGGRTCRSCWTASWRKPPPSSGRRSPRSRPSSWCSWRPTTSPATCGSCGPWSLMRSPS
jgi:hypothetical protein